MAISEKKMQIVIDNYFKSECNVDTSIRDAFEKGFRIGVQKTVQRPTGEWIYGEHEVAMCDGYRCDQCGYFVPWDYTHKSPYFIEEYHYCPSCGANMRGE